MSGNKKISLRKVLVVAVWLVLCTGIVVLLIAAISKKNSALVLKVNVDITGVQHNYFVDKKDVLRIITRANGGKLDKASIGSLDLAAMEAALQKDQWIEKSEIFLDNNNVLQVKIREREPVARIFTTTGASYYLDSTLTRLPLSEKFSARLPVFTDFPTEVRVLTKEDSALLQEIKTLTLFIASDPFWMAQIDQVNITPQRTFELIPKLGNQLVRFGNTDDYREKFNKLLAFYIQVQTRTGWNRYSVLDLQFKNQVVAVNRDAKEIKMDSLRVIQIMKAAIAEAQKRTNDSSNVQLPQTEEDNSHVNESPVISDVPEEAPAANVTVPPATNSSVKKPVVEPAKAPSVKKPVPVTQQNSTTRPAVTTAKKPVVKEPEKKTNQQKTEIKKPAVKPADSKNTQQPKAVMPPKSDY
jgi:cell division protein FtsQ